MSLFKQVSIVLIFIFFILFTLIVGLSFNIMKESTKKSLYENVQNSVTSLSLSITNAGEDESTIKTVINASFDNGNYEKIIFKNMQEEVVYEVQKELKIDEDIPQWFINFVDIEEISALATISNGWNVLGVLEIYGDRAIFYEQTYAIFTKLIVSLLISFAILLVVLFFLFTFILKPLKVINKQALAVMKNEFILSEKIPFTTEFKSLTLSINSMINKFENMFENTNNVLKLNKELLYVDEITKLNNRKYFILKANEYLDKDNTNNKGFVVIISLKIDVINKVHGYAKTNEILTNLSSNIKKEFSGDLNSVLARMNGSEFVALIPNILEDNIKDSLDKFIKKVKNIEELKNNINFALCKYENEDSTRTLLTKMDYAISQSKIHTENDYFYVKNIENYKTKEEWINILNVSLKEEHFKLMHRDILDINSKENLLKTISFGLEYEGEIIKYGEFIAPILEQNRLDEVYLHIIEKVFKSKENNLVSIQLPTMFIEKLSSYAKLKELLTKYKNQNVIFEIEEEAFNKNLNSTLMYVELFKENNFKFAIFNFIANSDDYSYLKELKPLYIKASKYFLLESRQSLNMLKILTQSLDIKLVATSVDDVSEITTLEEIGINAVSGSVMAQLKK
ncbi:bifunctional diguanylate cyclase/phosphodiesterase [Aliarcobacter butzleri]|uniref:Diguanylate cyclase n=1 Tax=Aliarcobacter butzleri L351 TaxID=1447259 RepID=A0A837J5X3_9BACT|nr:LapD/MoxY N-terminal periplasmic domain-containing protein [Aliarcobacter butzleri]KLE01389.1 diguanylate cyclase [Aliarcobacter butzleri L351]KLE13142.1 diguanylate cyclase [Aliarcobacter butzleri L350]MDN5046940.1 EAL domain-containing protein [Aliarcobacter butzleri]MDN5058890.1 EAL domain-containing protein [Aliarcobacter butzleri]MDN5109680.1 EAL domain-containing protein [Aliarcobacter butzleri]